ncbi:hypothetical protein [Frankia sp. Cas4]|uniref:hypothetical protein n=1 Tax=Frankia sp. Cas4 TaxID=3073927 RepID=UPI002AD2AF49|nr:hypothetical protein [Frankia sp. Cas4]
MYLQGKGGADSTDSFRYTAERVVGEKPVFVKYAVLEGEEWLCGHRHDDVVHEVDMVVMIGMESGAVLRIRWILPGFDQGLEAVLDQAPPEGLNTVDVTRSEQWLPLIGHPVSEVAVAWHVPYEGRPRLPWSLRLTFDGYGSAVVALGEEQDGTLVCHPTSLLVFFDEKAARSFVNPDDSLSSWGEVLR